MGGPVQPVGGNTKGTTPTEGKVVPADEQVRARRDEGVILEIGTGYSLISDPSGPVVNVGLGYRLPGVSLGVRYGFLPASSHNLELRTWVDPLTLLDSATAPWRDMLSIGAALVSDITADENGSDHSAVLGVVRARLPIAAEEAAVALVFDAGLGSTLAGQFTGTISVALESTY